MRHAGHIQIAQVPDRHEPDSPGEINFPYIFKLLEELGYQGYVGCEYKPLGEFLTGSDVKHWSCPAIIFFLYTLK